MSKFISFIVFIIIGPTVSGLVFLKLYSWFIEPIYDVPQLSLIQAIGITFFIGFLQFKIVKLQKKSEEEETLSESWTRFLTTIAAYFIILGIGWIYYLIFINA